jgi:hypothetical protein
MVSVSRRIEIGLLCLAVEVSCHRAAEDGVGTTRQDPSPYSPVATVAAVSRAPDGSGEQPSRPVDAGRVDESSPPEEPFLTDPPAMPSEECVRLARFRFVNGDLLPIPDSGVWDAECVNGAYISFNGNCISQPCMLSNGGPCFQEGEQACCAGRKCAGFCADGETCSCGNMPGGRDGADGRQFCKSPDDGQSFNCARTRNPP